MINTREIAEEYRLSHWAQVMGDRVSRGLSIKAYCREVGICGNTYFYWQRRVRAAAAEEVGLNVQDAGGSKQVCTGLSRTATETLAPIGWAQVETVAELPGAIELEINGCRVRVTAQADQVLLERVCRTLKSL